MFLKYCFKFTWSFQIVDVSSIMLFYIVVLWLFHSLMLCMSQDLIRGLCTLMCLALTTRCICSAGQFRQDPQSLMTRVYSPSRYCPCKRMVS